MTPQAIDRLVGVKRLDIEAFMRPSLSQMNSYQKGSYQMRSYQTAKLAVRPGSMASRVAGRAAA